MKTNDLIAQLGDDDKRKKVISPKFYILGLAIVYAVYVVMVQSYLGIRDDLYTQLTRVLFSAEIGLLVLLLISSSIMSVFLLFPDNYQKTKWLNIPYYVFAALLVILGVQLFLPVHELQVLPEKEMHGMDCLICIFIVSIVPALISLFMIKSGATTQPIRAGSCAIFSATALGCLTLRIAEMNDYLPHLLTWHYLPIFVFATIGALVGRFFLRW